MKPTHSPDIQRIQDAMAPLQQQIAEHPLPRLITTLPALQQVMTQHSFAVWDFVCLLKGLFARVVSVASPWLPPDDPDSARLLYEILIGEETDKSPVAGLSRAALYPAEPPAPSASMPHLFVSHFQWYLAAMDACGADTAPITQCLIAVKANANPLLDRALAHPAVLPSTRAFVRHTFETLSKPTPALAASFVFGREGMLPALFKPWLKAIERHKMPHTELLKQYLARHITLDSDEHFPKAAAMLARLCGDDASAWQAATTSATSALEARLGLLDGIARALR